MATNPKIKPCLDCGSADSLNVYKYDSGWCYVECDHNFNQRGACGYRGPGEGSVRQAIKSHNEKYAVQQHQKELQEAVRHGPGSS
jgi:hypothetical protein